MAHRRTRRRDIAPPIVGAQNPIDVRPRHRQPTGSTQHIDGDDTPKFIVGLAEIILGIVKRRQVSIQRIAYLLQQPDQLGRFSSAVILDIENWSATADDFASAPDEISFHSFDIDLHKLAAADF